MKRSLVLFLTVALLLMTTHRLPAPIQEVPESPTPTPAVAPAAQPRKSPPKPKAKPQTKTATTSLQAGATRFAGTWTGRIKFWEAGDVDVTLVINAEGTSVRQSSKPAYGPWTRPLTYNGKLLSWQTGPTNTVAWTLTLNPDEQSALVTRTWSGTQNRAIFKRLR